MHARVNFEVNGPGLCRAALLPRIAEPFKLLEAVDARLQSVLQEGGESGRFRVEDHDAGDNAVLTKLDALFGAGHSQQGYTVEFQQPGDGRTIGSVSGSFDHRNQVRGWICKFPDIRADAPKIMPESREIQLQTNRMTSVHKRWNQTFELCSPSALDEGVFSLKTERIRCQKLQRLLHGAECFFWGIAEAVECRTNEPHRIHAMAADERNQLLGPLGVHAGDFTNNGCGFEWTGQPAQVLNG